MTQIVKIENLEILNLLERHYYDFYSKENIIKYILANYEDLDSQLWDNYKIEYEKSFIEYEMIKNNFSYYLSNLLGIKDFDWTVVDFSERTVKVEEK